MNKQSVYILLFLVLLGGNMFLLAKLSWKKEHPKHKEPKEEIIQRLALDEGQISQYQTLITQHRKDIRSKEQEILATKKAIYTQLQANDSLLQRIGTLQIEIEKIHLAHFQDIQRLCRPEQKEAFDSLQQDLAKLFSPKPPLK